MTETRTKGTGVTETFIGRQPILDRNREVYAYELLYRAGEVNAAGVIDGEQATSQVIVNTFMEFGLRRLVGDRLAFLNVTRGFLLDHESIPLSSDQLGLEVSEDGVPDAGLLSAVTALSEQGYKIVLDNFHYREELLPLVKLAHLIKIDIRAFDSETLQDYRRRLRPYRAQLIADKVETQTDFAACRSVGFDFFQGYFLAKPSVLKKVRVAPSQLAVLRLLAALQHPTVTVSELETLISQDLALSYKLLRHINSAYFGLPKRIESIRRAVIYLGLQPIKRWVRMVALSGVERQPAELLLTALHRAKMCELLGQTAGQKDTDSYFTVGLFSALDGFLHMPMEQVLEELPLAPELGAALLHRKGPMGQALRCTLALEQANWSEVTFWNLSPGMISEAFVQASEWSREAGGELHAVARH
jgi:EAL and modified HD-GYP domain-containing signal transduction protein